jgi:hypothetical protein
MARGRSAFLLAGIAIGVAGCSVKVHQVPVDSTRLVPASVPVRMACDRRLQSVVDARDSTDRAGGLGVHLFLFDDVPGVVRKQFALAGLDAQGSGPAVDIRILQFYLAQNTMTKVPVAVYEVSVDGAAPFIVRSQKASMNWNGTENEAYGAYASALSDATAQAVSKINAGCRKPG